MSISEPFNSGIESFKNKADLSFQLYLSKYTTNIFGSAEYGRLISKTVKNGIISVTNKHLWTDTFPYANSPYIKAVPLIRNPFSFRLKTFDNSIPPFTRVLSDLALLIHRMQLLQADSIIIEDFGVMLYIMYNQTIQELDKYNFSQEQARVFTQHTLRQFLNSLSCINSLNETRVTLVFHDSIGMFVPLINWNRSEHSQRLRREPAYVEFDKDAISSFYSNISPVLQEFNYAEDTVTPPLMLLKRTEYLPKLDKMFIELYFDRYREQLNKNLTDREFLDIINYRDKRQYDKFAEKYFSWEDRRKLYCLSRKHKRCANGVPYQDTVARIWNSSIREKSNCEYLCYNPMEEATSPSQIFANTVIDYTSFTNNKTMQKFKETYLMAQTINQARRKFFGTDKSEMFTLNVEIINVPEEHISSVHKTIEAVNTNLTSTYMDEFSYIIKQDFTGYKMYKKQQWGNK